MSDDTYIPARPHVAYPTWDEAQEEIEQHFAALDHSENPKAFCNECGNPLFLYLAKVAKKPGHIIRLSHYDDVINNGGGTCSMCIATHDDETEESDPALRLFEDAVRELIRVYRNPVMVIIMLFKAERANPDDLNVIVTSEGLATFLDKKEADNTIDEFLATY